MPSVVEKSARVKANLKADPPIPNDLSASFKMSLPDTITEAVEMLGEQVVYDTFIDQMVVKAQAYVRGCLLRGSDARTIQELIDKWKLGERGEQPVDIVATLRETTANMNAEEALEYLQNLMKRAGKQVD